MDQAHISVATFGPARVVRLFGVVDLAARARLEYVLSEQVGADGAGDVEVNMAAVRLLDASAVAVLVRVRDELAARDRRLRVTGARGLVLEALEITGAAKQLGAYDDATPTAPGRTYAWGPEITELLREVARLPADDPTRARLRQQAVESCLPYVERLARRFASLGESQSDLTQVAAMGLLKAVDGFNHLRGADFLDVEKYPEIVFRGTRVVDFADNEFKLVGELTVREVTREVTLDVEYEGLARSPWGTEVIGFTASTEIDREDFDMTWNVALETGGVLVGKKVKIEISAEAIRQS